MKRKVTIGIVVCIAAMALVHAEDAPSVWDGVYTQEQASSGQELYVKQCVSCHRDKLQGHGQTPTLAGESFLEKWDGQTLGDLFEKMQASMPADHPGSLSRTENAQILAFILHFNEFPAGQTELRSDSEWLAKVRFQAAKPK